MPVVVPVCALMQTDMKTPVTWKLKVMIMQNTRAVKRCSTYYTFPNLPITPNSR